MPSVQLLDEELNIGGDYFLGGLRLGGRGKGSDVAGFVHGGVVAHGVVPPFLNGGAVFANKHALALAHASGGGKCKRRVPYPRNEVDKKRVRTTGRALETTPSCKRRATALICTLVMYAG